MVFKICEGIPCSSFYVKEFDVIVQVFSFYNPIKFLAILYPKSPTNLVVEVGIKHSHQGAVSIRKTVLPGMAIPMLKIRRPNGRLIFNMEITIRR